MGLPRQSTYARRLRFEPLESRRVLSITVDTLVSENNGVGQGAGTSLQEAILAAAPGDTIDFSVTGTIKLTLAVPTIAKNLTIRGPGANLLTIDANDPTPTTKNGDGARVFTIRDNNIQHLLDVSISGLTLTGGDSSNYWGGGGAINSYENLTVSDCVIVGNGSSYGNNYGGGAIQSIPEGEQYGAPNSLTVRNTVLSGNTTLQGEGGAIRKRFGTLLVEDCVITGNSAYWDGGGVSASDSVTVQINRSIINNNRTTYPTTNYGNGGGAFVFNGTMTVANSTISANTANRGGGLFGTNPSGYLILINSTVSGNSAASGGGVYAWGADVTNSTLSGNTAGSSGGAIWATGVTMTSSTVTANTSPAASAGAVRTTNFNSNASKISSSIIAGNTNGDVSLVGTTSLGYNLVGTGSGASGFNKTGDQTGVTNPMLGPLADNGGPTKTHAPLAGSPAIDAGNPAFNPANPDGNVNTNDALPFDQRGGPFTRVFGGRIDKGAVESQPVSATVMGDYNQDGVVDAGDYLVWQKARGATGVTPYTGADGSGNGVVDQADYSLWRFHFGSTVPVAGAGSGASSENLVASFGLLATESSIGDSVSQPPALPGVAPALTYVDMPVDVCRSIGIGERARVLPPAEPGAVGVARDDALVAWLESTGRVRESRAIEFEAISRDSRDISSDDSCDALDVAVGELMSAAL